MVSLIDNLTAFNRKERFHLLAYALGWNLGNYRLGQSFVHKIRENICSAAPDVFPFFAMDYHLDWLQAAIYLSSENISVYDAPDDCKSPYLRNSREITGSQEDIDLLVAFECSVQIHGTHLVLIEAKGFSGWNSKQIESKAKRLNAIMPDTPARITPHFILTSPGSRPSQGNFPKACRCLPTWAHKHGSEDECHWIDLPMLTGVKGHEKEFVRVVRCDGEGSGKGDTRVEKATHWQVRRAK